MSRPGRFGRRWRERKIEALERELAALHTERTSPWDRHPLVPFQINRFMEFLRFDPSVVLHVGRSHKEYLAEPGWDGYLYPEDAERAETLWLRCVLSGKPYLGLEYRWRHAGSGRYVYVSESLFPASWSPDGKPLRMEGWFENVTARKRGELEFLICCLDASGRSRGARGELVRLARRQAAGGPEAIAFLRPPRGGKPRTFR
jgi:PAS domain-containing protein